MEVIKSAFEVSPSTNIIGVLGSAGYTLGTAIADIVDNSIAAAANQVQITFNIKNTEDDTVMITDNGKGMLLENIKKAAVLAHTGKDEERAADDLGRYSLGLKSASMSFCDRLYIVSKEKNQTAHTIVMDFEEIVKTQKWNAYEVEIPEYEDLLDDSGTIIVWIKLKFINHDQFDRRLLNENIASAERCMNHTYSDYIKENRIAFKIGKTTIESWDNLPVVSLNVPWLSPLFDKLRAFKDLTLVLLKVCLENGIPNKIQ